MDSLVYNCPERKILNQIQKKILNVAFKQIFITESWDEKETPSEPTNPESIERFTEDQAFSTSQDLAPFPPPSPSPISKFDKKRPRKRDNLLTEGGGEPNHMTARKPGPL